MATNVPSPTFGATGFVAPVESDILTGTQADINAAFGGGLNMALTTSQGQLASALAAMIGDGNSQLLALFASVDPAYSFGRMQDALGRIVPGANFARIAAAPTVVQANCSGNVNVVIPAGAVIQDAAGYTYSTSSGGKIGVGGSVTVSFACTQTGPVPCPAQTFAIVRAIPGWDSAISSTAGVVGNLAETSSAFEVRRQASVAANANGTIAAIRGAVMSVAGVLDCYVTDNPTASPATIGGISIPANALYVAAIGGTSADVARAIWTKKPPGIPYYAGNTTVVVSDTSSGYAVPPTYSVTYNVPTLVAIGVQVVMTSSTAVPSTAKAQIQTAILGAFAGTDGGPRATIGSALYASRFYAAVANLGSWAQIIDIQLGTFTAASFTGSIATTTLTVSGVTGAIAIGQIVTGSNITTPTVITAGSGTSWTVATSQTAASGACQTAAMVNTVQLTIAQMPTLSASNIVLTLQ